MSWNYRVVKGKSEDGDEEYFGIHEVYYNKDGSIKLMTEIPVAVTAETLKGMQEVLKKMSDCLGKGVLVEGEIVFIDSE